MIQRIDGSRIFEALQRASYILVSLMPRSSEKLNQNRNEIRGESVEIDPQRQLDAVSIFSFAASFSACSARFSTGSFILFRTIELSRAHRERWTEVGAGLS